jgi:hypothetical protein
VVKLMAVTVSLLFGAAAHPLHTSFTEVTREPTEHVALKVRLFADDFSAALDSLGRTPAFAGATTEAIARRYFERSVSVQEKNGKPVALTWCGMRTGDGLTWLCARSATPVGAGSLRIQNTLMFDRFPDQISIIRSGQKKKARMLVLTARTPDGLLH